MATTTVLSELIGGPADQWELREALRGYCGWFIGAEPATRLTAAVDAAAELERRGEVNHAELVAELTELVDRMAAQGDKVHDPAAEDVAALMDVRLTRRTAELVCQGH